VANAGRGELSVVSESRAAAQGQEVMPVMLQEADISSGRWRSHDDSSPSALFGIAGF
jgi:hypothetical protein